MLDTNAVLKFMEAGGQKPSPELARMYKLLIMEEVAEFLVCMGDHTAAYHLRQHMEKAKEDTMLSTLAANQVDTFREVLDSIWVLVAFAHAQQWPLIAGWSALCKSNLAKIDPTTGYCRKDPQTGKILKPDGWRPPNIHEVLFPDHYRPPTNKGEVYDE